MFSSNSAQQIVQESRQADVWETRMFSADGTETYRQIFEQAFGFDGQSKVA
jgi:hypothetical protein